MTSPMPGSNPYLQGQANAITNQVTNNLQRNILPGVNTGSIASGGFGSNRHAQMQAQAIGDTNQGLSNSLSNLYGNAYAQDQQLAAQQSMHSAGLQNQYQIAQMNDATQRMGLQNQYSLGMGNLGLGYGNLGLGYQNSNNQFQLGMGACRTNRRPTKTSSRSDSRATTTKPRQTRTITTWVWARTRTKPQASTTRCNWAWETLGWATKTQTISTNSVLVVFRTRCMA